MTTLYNEITVNAPIEKVWQVLANLEELEKYDPAVKGLIVNTHTAFGVGSSRKVEMKDGKNWFEEMVIVSETNEALTYELTACSFPVDELQHSYTFEQSNNQIRIRQKMEYKIKYGLLGRIMDTLLIRKQYNKGITEFFSGLKQHVESN